MAEKYNVSSIDEIDAEFAKKEYVTDDDYFALVSRRQWEEVKEYISELEAREVWLCNYVEKIRDELPD